MRIKPALAEPPKKDPTSAEGAADLPYAMNNVSVSFGGGGGWAGYESLSLCLGPLISHRHFLFTTIQAI